MNGLIFLLVSAGLVSTGFLTYMFRNASSKRKAHRKKFNNFRESYYENANTQDGKLDDINNSIDAMKTMMNLGKPMKLVVDDEIAYFSPGGPLLEDLHKMSGPASLLYLVNCISHPDVHKRLADKWSDLTQSWPQPPESGYTGEGEGVHMHLDLLVYYYKTDHPDKVVPSNIEITSSMDMEDLKAKFFIMIPCHPDAEKRFFEKHLMGVVMNSPDLATLLRSVEYYDYKVDEDDSFLSKASSSEGGGSILSAVFQQDSFLVNKFQNLIPWSPNTTFDVVSNVEEIVVPSTGEHRPVVGMIPMYRDWKPLYNIHPSIHDMTVIRDGLHEWSSWLKKYYEGQQEDDYGYGGYEYEE